VNIASRLVADNTYQYNLPSFYKTSVRILLVIEHPRVGWQSHDDSGRFHAQTNGQLLWRIDASSLVCIDKVDSRIVNLRFVKISCQICTKNRYMSVNTYFDHNLVWLLLREW
jgi:hypothetical protein